MATIPAYTTEEQVPQQAAQALLVSTAYQGAVAITPGTAFAAGRGIGYVCTTAGTATLTLANGTTLPVPVAVSAAMVIVPFAATNIALSGGAAGTFYNLS